MIPGAENMNAASAERRPQPQSCGWRVLLAATLLLNGSLHESASSATLQALLSGGSMNVNNSVFSDWQLLSLDSTAGVNLDLSLINVNPMTSNPSNPGILFGTASQLAVAGINAIDLVLQFRVDALAGSNSFTGHSLLLSGITPGSVGGITYISDEMTSHVDANLGSGLVIFDNVSGVNQLVSTSSFTPQSGMTVVTNVFITGVTSSDSIGLTSFIQQFAQNGSPVLVGDYNTNGTVDAADYVVWRKTLGQVGGPLPADGNNNGQIDSGDLTVWRAHFGQPPGGGLGTSVSVAIPEPSAVVLLMFAAAGRFLQRRRVA
jgi:hypothetical protein